MSIIEQGKSILGRIIVALGSTSQSCKGLIGENTEVTINFDYTESEPQTLDDPGCGATVEISTITICSEDTIRGFLEDDIIDSLSQETIDAFEVKCHEYMENPERDE